MPRLRAALVYGVPLGPGGLAVQSANAIAALSAAERIELHAIGPAPASQVQLDPRVRWHIFPGSMPVWSRLRGLRAYQGAAQVSHDTALGRWAAQRLHDIAPSICYAFTQVALESLQFCETRGVPTVLESPNGHIRDFRQVYLSEHERWCRGRYTGHPVARAVARVEEEYRVAARIRASSDWTRESLIRRGVDPGKVAVLQQPLDLDRYSPGPPNASGGPLRVVFVGTLDLRKGFVYLLQAVRRMRGEVTLEIVGGTVDRCTRLLLAREARDLPVTVAPGDPRPAFHRADLSVLPTLEDGSPFAAAEAMACGLPIVVTDSCGSREWVERDRSGWIVPARSVDALENVFRTALNRRDELRAMGQAARAATERRADPAICHEALRQWVLSGR